MASNGEEQHGWPFRTWLFFGAGAAAGFLVHLLTDTSFGNGSGSVRLALATFTGTAVAAAAFTLDRGRSLSTLVFAIVAAFVVASVIYWNGGPGEWDASNGWRLLCAAITVAIAAPLFQAWRGRQAGALQWRAPVRYEDVHDRAWTNILLWCLAWAFAGIVLLLGLLLSELFRLIGIDLLRDLLREDWFMMTLTGAALGGGVGLLRDRDRILAALQRVAMTVLAVLAPVLGAGLLLFVLALPFTGLTPLWDATRATTPILLSCIVAAVLLMNAVIGDSPEDEAKMRVLRWGAMALGATMLPLAVIAAISTGLRIDQYGLTPDRLWAVVFTAIAVAFGLAYAVSLLRGRARWAPQLRRSNLILAFALCGVAFILSTPLLSFGALSTRDQVARLMDGRTKPDQFDWAALWFDFGPAGKQAVRELARNGATADIRKRAKDVQVAKYRWDWDQSRIAAETLERRLLILPERVPLPQGLQDRLRQGSMCGAEGVCALHFRPGDKSAVLITMWCPSCGPAVSPLYERNGRWEVVSEGTVPLPASQSDAERKALGLAIRQGRVEVRPVERRQVFVDGKPVGQPFQ